MRIEHLRLFRQICLTQSISKVAQRNYMSRTSLSEIVSKMEDELGYDLLMRSKKGVVPTEKGRLIFEQSANIVETYDGWLNLADNTRALSGQLVLGVHSNYARELLNEVIFQCNSLYPQVDLLLSVSQPGKSDLLIQGLNNGSVSIVYAPGTREETLAKVAANEYEVDVLHCSNTCIVMRRDHPLASRAELSPADLQDLTYILPAYSSKHLAKFTGFFKNTICYADTEGVLCAIDSSDFVTILSPFALINKRPGSYRLIPCPAISETVSFSLTYPNEIASSLIERKFVELFKSCFAEFCAKLSQTQL